MAQLYSLDRVKLVASDIARKHQLHYRHDNCQHEDIKSGFFFHQSIRLNKEEHFIYGKAN